MSGRKNIGSICVLHMVSVNVRLYGVTVNFFVLNIHVSGALVCVPLFLWCDQLLCLLVLNVCCYLGWWCTKCYICVILVLVLTGLFDGVTVYENYCSSFTVGFSFKVELT
jgi:hypothetical protein